MPMAQTTGTTINLPRLLNQEDDEEDLRKSVESQLKVGLKEAHRSAWLS